MVEMVTEQCKEAWERIPVADRARYSTGPATRDKQVDHTRGRLLVAAVGPAEVDSDKVAAAVGTHKGEVVESSRQAFVAAGSMGDQAHLWGPPAVVGKTFFGAGPLQGGNRNCLCSCCCLEN